MTRQKLLSSDSEDDTCPNTILGINKSYANRYDNWRRLEELQKIKDRYGELSDDSSSSEEEVVSYSLSFYFTLWSFLLCFALDQDWSAADEMRFLRTLSALKEDNDSIYDEKSRFWTHSEVKQKNGRKTLQKQRQSSMYLKDYERKLILEKEGLEREEEDFYSWMKSHGNEDVSDNDFLKGLKKAWKNPEIDEGEKFLRDYLMNEDFVPSEKDQIVTFDDIREMEEDEKDLEMQRNFEHKYNFRFEEPDQEFIKQYPRTVGESLRRRNSKRKEKREQYKERKEKEKRERKQVYIYIYMCGIITHLMYFRPCVILFCLLQEIREMKKMMKAEIERKLEQLKKMAGDDIALNVDDLMGDFDPKEYDKRMAYLEYDIDANCFTIQQVFNDEYYGKGDNRVDEDATRVKLSDVDDVYVKLVKNEDDSSDYDNLCVPSASTARDTDKTCVTNCEDDPVQCWSAGAKLQTKNGNFNDLCSYCGRFLVPKLSVLLDSRRKKKRKSTFWKALHKEKPLFNPNEKTFEEYFNEYYALDYEDIIGTLLTCFHGFGAFPEIHLDCLSTDKLYRTILVCLLVKYCQRMIGSLMLGFLLRRYTLMFSYHLADLCNREILCYWLSHGT
ncbi:unnamed protein product [Angiostrongylus costaricensis]|uniref:Protein KRI1 homolog n=1 Tax=Angiostrongylus costaricensis TaxID=334426 RepID=A0A0R3PMG2_ANGCS|nr:unnamed protein product [Angiostrongylus costaricensis]